jgi:hypothetical protein
MNHARSFLSLVGVLSLSLGQNSFGAENPTLMNNSLPEKTSRLFIPPESKPGLGDTKCYAGSSRHISAPYLLSTIDEPRRFVAIAERQANSNDYLLNPNDPEYDYGNLPTLAQLSQSRADTIYGTATNLGTNKKRYTLASLDNRKFYLDLDFKNNLVHQYRIFPYVIQISNKPQEAIAPDWKALTK